MLKNISKQINISAISEVTDASGKQVAVLTMFSAIQADGKPSFNQAVNDVSLYEAHMKEADADFAQFKGIAMDEAKDYEKQRQELA